MDQQAIVPKAVIRLSGRASEPDVIKDTAHTIVVLIHELHGGPSQLARRILPFLHAKPRQLIIVNYDMMTAWHSFLVKASGSPMSFTEEAHAILSAVSPYLCEAAKLVFMSREQYRASSAWDPEDDKAMAWPAGSNQ
jgi:hypothetical protein